MRCIERITSFTSAADPGVQFIGGGPARGDCAATGIVLPADPTTDANNRYLVRLAGIQIPPKCKAIVKSVRQLVNLGADVSMGEGTGQVFTFEKQILSPTWRFSNGNIAWSLTKTPKMSTTAAIANMPTVGSGTGNPSPYTYDAYGITQGILYNRLPASVDVTFGLPYIPPFNGSFPGTQINNLGVWRDLRFPWYNFNEIDMGGMAVEGPGSICLYASVYQTDTQNRNMPALPANVLPSWLSPEDQFVYANYCSARYYRIAGEIVVDIVSE